MEWHLYKKDDPSTWPEIDCPILVYDESLYDFYICKWDPSLSKFVEPKENIIHYWSECYYQYIGYVPNGYEVYNPARCTEEDHKCPECDDGYCVQSDYWNPELSNCKYKKPVNEYSVTTKRIWKEFK